MSQVRVTEAFLDAIADAIRAKLGVADTYKPSEMAEAILEISGGGGDMSIIADEYSSSATYAEGDYCIHVGTLCKCITAISTPEEWNANHWGTTDVATELNRRLKPSDVVNNLTSTSTIQPLSAAQGKALNDSIATVDVSNHFTQGSDTGALEAYKSGNLVYGRFRINSSTYSGTVHVGDSDSSYKPITTYTGTAVNYSSGMICGSIYVSATGSIDIYISSSVSAGIEGSFYYMLP